MPLFGNRTKSIYRRISQVSFKAYDDGEGKEVEVQPRGILKNKTVETLPNVDNHILTEIEYKYDRTQYDSAIPRV